MHDIRALLAAEIAARDEFTRHATQELTYRNGRIAMLEELLQQTNEQDTTPRTTPHKEQSND